MVMRSEVIIASQIDLSEAIITQQVPEAKLLSIKRNLRSKTPIKKKAPVKEPFSLLEYFGI